MKQFIQLVILLLVAGVLAGKQQNCPNKAGCNETSNASKESNACISARIVCPAVDGKDSVYGALPNCSQFCQCSNGVPYLHNCSAGLHFNPKLNVCDWPINAGCAGDGGKKDKNDTNCDNKKPNTENACISAGIVCPAVDGKNSVYGALPNCSQFCQCSNGVPYLHNCSAGLHFNPKLNVCDRPINAGCAGDGGKKDKNDTNCDDKKPNTENACISAGIVCPAVDGKDSVYGALPNCSQFCQCSNGVPYLHNCSAGLHFNPILNVCDWPKSAGCTRKSKSNKNCDHQNVDETDYDCEGNPKEILGTILGIKLSANQEGSHCFGIECPDIEGMFPIFSPSTNCSQFCACFSGQTYAVDCPPGLFFNQAKNVCDFNADCLNA